MKNEVDVFWVKSVVILIFVSLISGWVISYFKLNLIFQILFCGSWATIFVLCYYQGRRNKRRGKFILYMVKMGYEIDLADRKGDGKTQWDMAKIYARDEKKRKRSIYLLEATDKGNFRVDFSRRAELKATIKEAFGRR